MGKRTSPIITRLGISIFWKLPPVPYKTNWNSQFRLLLICFRMLTNLFYKEKVYFANIRIDKFLLTNVTLTIEYFFQHKLAIARYSSAKISKLRKIRLPLIKRSSVYNIVQKLSNSKVKLNSFYYFTPYVQRASNAFIAHVWRKKQLVESTVLSRRRTKVCTSPVSKRRNNSKVSKNGTYIIFNKILELRLKNFLEHLLASVFGLHFRLVLTNLANLFVRNTSKNITVGSNVFELIRIQLLYSIGSKKDGHNMFGLLTGIIITGCYISNSQLLLMWLTLKLSTLRKFDLYYTQTKLVSVFFFIIKNAFFLVNTLKGIRLQISGKLNGKMRASQRSFLIGTSISKQTFCNDVDYYSGEAYTYSGTINCQLWLLKHV
jgi:hypothetical protein